LILRVKNQGCFKEIFPPEEFKERRDKILNAIGQEALKSMEILKELTDFIWKNWLREIENISIGVGEVAEFFEANREKAEFLRSEFFSEGVDLYEIPQRISS